MKYENQEIADMLGTTYNMVAKEKSKAKRGKKMSEDILKSN